MNDELKRPYNPNEHEESIYKKWEESGFFNPDVCIEKGVTDKNADYFSIVLPPPNATGILHLGHALEDSLQDTAVRFQRMIGKKTLWVPGTDHAAIATNTKVEKEMIKNEGKNRHDVGRENFIERVENYVAQSRGTISKQVRRMGASCDWSREAFTFDEKRSFAVNTAFKKMYEAGLIYRGYRVINWDPKGQTTVSDDEVIHKPEKGKLYTFRYSKDFPIPIATTRPETKVGDTAIAVNPEDARYNHLIGKEFNNINFAGAILNIKIIGDNGVDQTYGTGAVGVTPAHSLIDAEMAKNHNLQTIQVIDEYARMTEEAGKLVAGKKTKEARELIVNWLKENNLFEKEEEIEINISIADRSGGTIEPLPKLQWFVNVNQPIKERGGKTLKELMQEPVEKSEIKIMPERFEKIYYHWIKNLRDWCISRQLWYGHRIPVYYRGTEIFVGEKSPGDDWVSDKDTLDTWFSSALWTFSTLGWPEETLDLRNYHPTSLMDPGYEILFFWVARMILMSQFLLRQVPFRAVYLHGILRDKKGQKFSKSLGNGVDPIEIIDKYGADALRMSLTVAIGPGNDSNFDEQKVKAYKNFANKIWNASRFVLENTSTDLEVSKVPFDLSRLTHGDKKIVKEYEEFVKDMTADMENYRFYLAAEKIYHYFWHTFADIIIEDCKKTLRDAEDNKVQSKESESAKNLLYYLLKEQLKLLHPFMPFITEKIWSMLPHFAEASRGKPDSKDLLMVQRWPNYS